jgi:peptide/nickel transport system substrate-binding protein
MRNRCIVLKIVLILVFGLGVIFTFVEYPMAQSKEPVILKSWLPNWPDCIEIWRLLSEDLKKLGIQVELKTGQLDEWNAEIIGRSNPYHLVTVTWSGAPDRLDPTFFLTEFFHSSRAVPGGRNYGYYVNKEYDKIVEAQAIEMDMGKRQKLVREAQEMIAKDNPIFPIFHRDYVQAYNKERIDGVIPVMGSGIGFPYIPWTFLKAKPKKDIKEPRVVSVLDIQTLNPFASMEAWNDSYLRLAYDTLAKRDSDTNLIPWAAESWRLVDNTTVDLVLREGMKFHDGKPVTVEDVKFTFDYIKKWKFPGLSQTWNNVESVRIVDGRKIRLKLYKPFASFETSILIHTFIAPKHIWEKIPESVGVANPMDWPNPNPIGSGPYQFLDWKKGEYFHLKANKNHWMAPNFDGLYHITTPTMEGIMGMLEKGDAEIIGWFLDIKQAKRLDALPHLKAVSAPNHGIHEMRPNLKMKPMDDPMFRRAFQHAINRKAMLDVVCGGYGTISYNTPISPLIKFWNNPKIPVIEFNLDKAKDILKAAGYTWDEKGRLCYPKK